MDPQACLDCGHPPTKTDGIGTGVAYDRDGASMCYACAFTRTVTDIAALEPGAPLPVLYLSKGLLVTWDGQRVGRLLNRGALHPWSRERRYMTFTLDVGGCAHGTGAEGMYCSLRRSKG